MKPTLKTTQALWAVSLFLFVFGLIYTFTSCQKDTIVPNENAKYPTPSFAVSVLCDEVIPVFSNTGPGGNAECPVGYEFTSERYDVDQSLPYPQGGSFGPITWEISANGQFLSWSGNVCGVTVIVKGGPASNSYTYNDCKTGSGLHAPEMTNPKGKIIIPQISNITFCWNACSSSNCSDETAWAAGARYNINGQGNWATYTEYAGVEKTVDLMAGQTHNIGTVTFSDSQDGFVTITIDLNANGYFQNVPENVKLQGYVSAPSGNPALGQFDIKRTASGTTYSLIGVPVNNYYGVHVDGGYCE